MEKREIGNPPGNAGRRSRGERLILFSAVSACLTALAVFSLAGMGIGLDHTSEVDFCVSCHEMRAVYQRWKGSRHSANDAGVVAGCSDCHLPPGLLGWAKTKATQGMKDLYVHYLGSGGIDSFKRAETARQGIVNDSCTQCHRDLFPPTLPRGGFLGHSALKRDSEMKCVSCHRGLHV